MKWKINWMIKFLAFLLVCLTLSCVQKEKKKAFPYETKREYEQAMIQSHQQFLQKEKLKIKKFTDSSGLEFIKTGTGLQYHIFDSTDGEVLKSGDLAMVKYLLTTIEGDTVYQSPNNKLQEFAVDYDNVESGLHEGIKFMRTGERALLILPAHLAHGITGDQAAISTQTTLVYDIYLAGKR